jgi:hypothetical protein
MLLDLLMQLVKGRHICIGSSVIPTSPVQSMSEGARKPKIVRGVAYFKIARSYLDY